jgi:hypothetical protein
VDLDEAALLTHPVLRTANAMLPGNPPP